MVKLGDVDNSGGGLPASQGGGKLTEMDGIHDDDGLGRVCGKEGRRGGEDGG